MKYPCTGVILAGGLSTRFAGKNKAFVEVGGVRIIDRIYDTLKDLFEEIILITNDPLEYIEYDALIGIDLFEKRSSLNGIYSGLFYSSHPHVFITACDTPFLQKELVEMVTGSIDDRFDVVMPRTSGGSEPLCAVYSKKSLNRIGQHLIQDKHKIQRVFRQDRIKIVSEKSLRKVDPDLISFFNVNSSEDLVMAETLAKQGKGD
ncbi:MAG: molybdenum cofactor guanylyltransferase [Desulfobacterales bacterium]|nr:molybdenum cofactor guanylyltransferase [Desulfobacterales bacterium]